VRWHWAPIGIKRGSKPATPSKGGWRRTSKRWPTGSSWPRKTSTSESWRSHWRGTPCTKVSRASRSVDSEINYLRGYLNGVDQNSDLKFPPLPPRIPPRNPPGCPSPSIPSPNISPSTSMVSIYSLQRRSLMNLVIYDTILATKGS
jgi:hypothetical protein